MITTTPNSHQICKQYCKEGKSLIDQGKIEEAQQKFSLAMCKEPTSKIVRTYSFFCKEVLSQLQPSAYEQGDARAEFNIGSRYQRGKGVPQSYVKAAEWYLRSALQGNTNAQLNLGVLFARGQGVIQLPQQAETWLTMSAKGGNVHAMWNLGLIYANGLGVEQSDEKARQFYQMAADQKYEPAIRILENK